MNKSRYRFVLVSDFNLQNFADYAAHDGELPGIDPVVAPMGQPVSALVDPKLPCWRNAPDVALIWTQPQSAVPAFKALLRYEKVSLETILQQVDEYCEHLINSGERVKWVFVPTWVLPSDRRVFGLLEMQTEVGLTNTIMRMNLRLAENLENATGIHVLDTHRWLTRAGKSAFSPKLWYLGKIPFSNDVFKAAIRDIKAALRGMRGESRKLILVDLDDTLWGGIVGDAGLENLVLGGHHHIGEAYVDFQLALKSMQNRGILLAIVSKNEEAVALEAIRKHPEMVLRVADFAGWRINWQDKVHNIIELLTELNLGPQSAVFIDDNPAERARVKESLAEILVPDWPRDPLHYPSALFGLKCFELPSLSREDLSRTEMYLSESRRREIKKNVSSLEEWLARLEIRVQIDELVPANLPRAAQLLNRTNQFNLSTRRMSEAELGAWAEQKNHKLWTLRVSDKFGDAGLTGIVSLEIQDRQAQIADFILSCRVMGRKIEETMIATTIHHTQAMGIQYVYARYIPTAKNRPCLNFLESLAPFFYRKGDCFIYDDTQPFAFPDHIEVVMNTST